MKKLSPEEALKALEELPRLRDPAMEHVKGDFILCALLRFLNQDEVAEEFERQSREWWYE